MSIIKTFDWEDYTTNPKKLVGELATAFETTGFCIIENHGMNQVVIQRGEDSFKEFFRWPFTRQNKPGKEQYSFPEQGYQVGYTPFGIEKGVGADAPDQKEFFHAHKGKTPIVAQLPDFTYNVDALWMEFKKFSTEIAQAIALSIREDKEFFSDEKYEEKGLSLLRGIHYLPQKSTATKEEVVKGGNIIGMCASAHTDINLFTLLLAKEAGLQLWYKQEWVPITIEDPNALILNCGDMLEHLTNGIYRSGLHRVVCEKGIERSSIPYFEHVPPAFNIRPLSQFGDAKPEYLFETAGEFLHDRLKAIKLIA